MPPDEEVTGMDAAMEALFKGPGKGAAEDAGKRGIQPTPAPEKTDNRQAEGDDSQEEQQEPVDNDIDPEDFDALEEGEQQQRATNPDDVEYEVTVDEKPTKATLRELKAAFSGAKAIETRVQQAGEQRRNAEVYAGQLMQGLEATSQRLAALDMILADAENNGINWDQLRVSDPQRYLIEKERQRDIRNKRAYVVQQQQQVQLQQQQIANQRQTHYAQEQSELLARKIPEFADPEKARPLIENMAKTARAAGFTDQEIATVLDHRQVIILNKAMKYDALVAAKKARGNGQQHIQPKPLMRPGTTNFGQRMNNIKAEKDAAARAAETGNPDDVAASLLVTPKRGIVQKRTGF